MKRGFRYEGFSVDHLEDGKDVVNQQKKESYDVIILDIMLPTVNGDEVLKKLRENNDTIPVIVLTAIDDVETKTKILNLGADDYLVKPFSFVELVARIKTVHRRAQGAIKKKDEIKVGNLVLNPQTRTVTREGKIIKLRLKEYRLLEYFMRNADTVISRDMLIGNVWKYDAKIYSNTIDSHISLLRGKLNKGFNDKLIETVHGVGYMLRSDSKQ
jgi:DNA-binding response OmpR family regulator